MKKILLIVIISILLVSGCSITGDVIKKNLPSSTTAKDIVPSEISNYKTVNTDTLAAKASAAIVGLTVSGLTAENIAFTYKSAQFTEKFVTCYQEAGAINSNGYYRKDNPLYGGAIVVADKNQLSDSALFLNCIRKSGTPFSVISIPFDPCAKKFKIETPFNTFYVLVLGTDASVCGDICKTMITGCQ